MLYLKSLLTNMPVMIILSDIFGLYFKLNKEVLKDLCRCLHLIEMCSAIAMTGIINSYLLICSNWGLMMRASSDKRDHGPVGFQGAQGWVGAFHRLSFLSLPIKTSCNIQLCEYLRNLILILFFYTPPLCLHGLRLHCKIINSWMGQLQPLRKSTMTAKAKSAHLLQLNNSFQDKPVHGSICRWELIEDLGSWISLWNQFQERDIVSHILQERSRAIVFNT